MPKKTMECPTCGAVLPIKGETISCPECGMPIESEDEYHYDDELTDTDEEEIDEEKEWE